MSTIYLAFYKGKKKACPKAYIPEEKEFWVIVNRTRNVADQLVLEKYDLNGLTEKQIEYLLIREKNIEMIGSLGWRIEGGKL